LEKLKRLGADTVINYKAVPDWGQKAKDLTDGRGVDHVIEVGGPGTLTQSITACRTGGHIALIGVLTGFAGEVAISALFSNSPVDCWDAPGGDANVSDILPHLSAYDVTREVWAKCWERRPTPIAHPSM
jgi:NADPH:quinone reductase-like Zn-dependent oxidoreductase